MASACPKNDGTVGGTPQKPATSLESPPGSTDLARGFDELPAAREDLGSMGWWFVVLQLWAPSMLYVYDRHLRNIKQP